MEVLRARHEDVEWLAGQLRDFSSALNTKHSYIPPSDESLRSEITALIDSHVLLIAWDKRKRVGTIGGMCVPHPYNPDVRTLVERFWWVPEENRGSRAGYLLLRAFSKIGESFDCVTMSLLPSSPVPNKALERFGFQLSELSFIKEN